MSDPIIVIGGNVGQAKEYCARKGLGYGTAIIINAPEHLYGRHKPKVTLTGTFRYREDAAAIVKELEHRQAIVTFDEEIGP